MSMENKIVMFASNNDYAAIECLKQDMQVEKMKMDKFFTMFLDKFEKKMNPDITNTKVWDLYKAKMKEYENISRAIKLTDYYLKRGQNV